MNRKKMSRARSEIEFLVDIMSRRDASNAYKKRSQGEYQKVEVIMKAGERGFGLLVLLQVHP